MGMAETGGDLDLTQEASYADRGGELATQNFECHEPIVLQITGKVHRRHPAPPQLTLDVEPIRERCRKTRQGISRQTAAPKKVLEYRVRRYTTAIASP